MANEFFIEKVTYMSTDWHDWEQFTDFIEAEPNQYAFPTKQTVDVGTTTNAKIWSPKKIVDRLFVRVYNKKKRINNV